FHSSDMLVQAIVSEGRTHLLGRLLVLVDVEEEEKFLGTQLRALKGHHIQSIHPPPYQESTLLSLLQNMEQCTARQNCQKHQQEPRWCIPSLLLLLVSVPHAL